MCIRDRGSINSPLINIAGAKLAEKTIFAASTTEDANDRAKALHKRLVAKYPNMPAFVSAAQGYDAVMLIAAAIQQAGSTDGDKVQQSLENLGEVQGIIKAVSYTHLDVYKRQVSRSFWSYFITM